jgi:hypothetical protein
MNGVCGIPGLLEDRLLRNPVVNDEEATDKCAEELTSSIQEAPMLYVAKSLPHANPRSVYSLLFRLKGQ